MNDNSDIDSIGSGAYQNSNSDSTNDGSDDRNETGDIPYDDDSARADDDAIDQDVDISSQGDDTGSMNEDYDQTDSESDGDDGSPDKLSHSQEDDDDGSKEEEDVGGDDEDTNDFQSRFMLGNAHVNEFDQEDVDANDDMEENDDDDEEELNAPDEEDATPMDLSDTVTETPVKVIMNTPDNHFEEEAVAVTVEVSQDLSNQDGPVVAAVVNKKTRKKPDSSTKKNACSPKKSKSAKKKSPSSHQKKSDLNISSHANAISRERLEAAQQARTVLVSTVGQMPFVASDSHIVQNFGRIKVEESDSSLFSTPTSLFPVGFICDRYEFSPVHGRVLKMRCEILDGNEFEENVKASHGIENHKGPIFRISWGEGIDELRDGKPFPFDIYSSCSPLMNGVDTVAVPLSFRSNAIKPEKDMRVSVRFDKDAWYRGTIRKVVAIEQKREDDDSVKKRSSKKKKQVYTITIKYDDGLVEETLYPDPDISLVSPGSDAIFSDGSLTVCDVNGLPVTSVVGTSSVEAWANALIKLGLIDEIIYERSLECIAENRAQGMADVECRMEALRNQRREARARQIMKQKGVPSESKDDDGRFALGGDEKKDATSLLKAEKDFTKRDELKKENKSDAELDLEEQFLSLYKEYQKCLEESQKVTIELASSRIETMSPFLMNPFYDYDLSLQQQKNWMMTVVKKEKAKMGSTGNKRKIVTPTDMLDRNATFFNSDIERLLEGLPGSEHCPDYIFHQTRGPGSSTYAILHEVKLQKEKENQSKKKRAKENEVKLSEDKENAKKRKRKVIEDEKTSKKKAKDDEVDQVKQARKEERLSKLSGQIEERLFKEACAQRERVILLASKLLQKEMLRRQKVAEVLAGHNADNEALPVVQIMNPPVLDELPPLAQEVDVNLVKIHDFLHTFKDFFIENGLTNVPTLNQLRDAIMVSSSTSPLSTKLGAIGLLNEIATAFCKPLAPSLLKVLSSALTTSLQEKKTDDDPDDFIVNIHTWREVARLFFLSEVLNELGLTKVEQTHVLRGYRSGGHPNSKEAKRIRRGEDSALVLRRQELAESSLSLDGSFNEMSEFKLSLPVPCKPRADPSNWMFFLYNIKSLPSNAATGMKSNLRKACTLLKSYTDEESKAKRSELEAQIDLLDQIGTTITSSLETIELCRNVKNSVLKVLDDASGDSFSDDKPKKRVIKDKESTDELKIEKAEPITPHIYKSTIDEIFITESNYKKLSHAKEAYMVAAIRFKEERERRKMRNNSMEDDDDDDDDDDEVDMNTAKGDQSLVTANVNSDLQETTERSQKSAEYDEFAGDDPKAPELVRRCLSVLRNLCHSSPAEAFLYPVDPQTNMKYYESVLRPMSLYDVGQSLQKFARKVAEYGSTEQEIEHIVFQFARDVRLIGQNATCFSNPGGPLISTAEEMMRVFERLLFDWILAPSHLLPPLEMLDDEKCVTVHESDEESMILICDGCEGKYNMSLLRPKLFSVPKSDWYCPRCRSRYSWSSVDPRLGMKITIQVNGNNKKGKIKECILGAPRLDAKKTLFYRILNDDGSEYILNLEEVDAAIRSNGQSVPPIRCLDAVVESPGYGCGTDNGLVLEVLPVLLNPTISDVAAQKFLESTSFQDVILSSASLLSSSLDGLSSSEWIRLLNQLSMKCMTSDSMQDFASKLESSAEEALAIKSATVTKIKSIKDVLPEVSDDEAEIVHESNTKMTDSSSKDLELVPSEIVTDPNKVAEESVDNGVALNPVLEQANHAVKSARKRQKKRDDAFLCAAVKAQVESAVLSFEEDNITKVINQSFSKEIRGLDITSIQCPGMTCQFCGLSDEALGTPLLRFPNENEWIERVDSICCNKRDELVAEIGTFNQSNDDSGGHKNKFVAVQIRLSGDLVADDESFKGRCLDFTDLLSCGLLPRNERGFQYELKTRSADDLPIITGSMVAHECCALTAHRVRVEKKIQRAKDHMLSDLEKSQANSCGRTLSIGSDSTGRTYWKFESNPGKLFVLDSRNSKKRFWMYDSPESIASVIVSIGKCATSEALRKLYPSSDEMLDNREWANLLQKRAFQKRNEEITVPHVENNIHVEQGCDNASNNTLDVFESGDDVLVESNARDHLWDATIVSVGTTENDEVVSYRVHYKEWSYRFDEWVHPSRVFELNDENMERQQQLSFQPNGNCLPEYLQTLAASSFLSASNRQRSVAYQPDFSAILKVPKTVTSEDTALAEMKAAILLIEAAMPYGSMRAIWKFENASNWRKMVLDSRTPGSLMGCVVLFENSVLKDWIRPSGEHFFASLPRPWKAISEASVAAIALRIWTLDGSLKYAKGGEAWSERKDSF